MPIDLSSGHSCSISPKTDKSRFTKATLVSILP
ncbi:Uncharacterised protein [Vibrio cholerae]|nr:Uncharacterised protein [Vibrio cholerae]